MDALKFSLGESVFHQTGPDHYGIVTGILFRPGGHSYYVTWDDLGERSHYEFELTDKKPVTELKGS